LFSPPAACLSFAFSTIIGFSFNANSARTNIGHRARKVLPLGS
jgi:hypothetical protein